MSGENHFLTPTYQSPLIMCIEIAARRIADADTEGGYQALKTLYSLMPKECQKDVYEKFLEIRNQLEIIAVYGGVTEVETQLGRYNRRRRYLGNAILELLDESKSTLFRHGYLENAPTRPRNSQPTTLGAQP
jgi:hypothetical protein